MASIGICGLVSLDIEYSKSVNHIFSKHYNPNLFNVYYIFWGKTIEMFSPVTQYN